MKVILISLFLFGCSQKYTYYPVINKKNFNVEQTTPPKSVPPMIKAKAEVEEFCEGQIFFNKNAFNITESSIKALVQHSCPGSDYLIDAKLTKLWWTTIVYSRSCVTLESYCPQKRSK
tara:strand:- start:96554 stop:96907 length:354 start_codon:yes stop_codon:yes gene_type:complete